MTPLNKLIDVIQSVCDFSKPITLSY